MREVSEKSARAAGILQNKRVKSGGWMKFGAFSAGLLFASLQGPERSSGNAHA
ncbi:hypothetical protein [Bradyrhizobium sp. 143]|uniref:hypothetical protein n=1 Tax=Bradyrhizobium sp. 143 TaxID=2782619 RepID=UPI001FFA0140|nr:hypothetical protein [Bradyrhizobium sp. 143]MCK1709606.1 hypothetical protein [Bradyrhizobium sp. 143]